MEPQVSLWACERTNEYFKEKWPFDTVSERERFASAMCSEILCRVFPRQVRFKLLLLVSKLVSLQFLIDQWLEHMPPSVAKRWSKRIQDIASKGTDYAPDKQQEIVVQSIWHQVYEINLSSAQALVCSMKEYMNARLEDRCPMPYNFETVLQQRAYEVGGRYVAALIAFGLDIEPAVKNSIRLRPMEQYFCEALAILNDLQCYAIDEENPRLNVTHALIANFEFLGYNLTDIPEYIQGLLREKIDTGDWVDNELLYLCCLWAELLVFEQWHIELKATTNIHLKTRKLR